MPNHDRCADSPRRRFLSRSAALCAGALLPVTAGAMDAKIHALSGAVLVNGAPISARDIIGPGDVVFTGARGSVWFTVGSDAYFLREHTELRVEPERPGEQLIAALRLISGALGATFARGAKRRLVSRTVTLGIRGTGVYLETTAHDTYACTCFGASEIKSNADGAMMESIQVVTGNHFARRIRRDPEKGMQMQVAPFEHHTNAEMARLEALAGRPDPFTAHR